MRQSRVFCDQAHIDEAVERVHELLRATPEEDIKRRYLYDGALLIDKGWTRGQVAICGDAVHPMMPNLGQGGCQATEDSYRLGEELSKVKTLEKSRVP